ncbi:MAG TPA: acyl-ACP--UDP-N-acetylglucosamine O-acyltransferase [Labilithrix sp.]
MAKVHPSAVVDRHAELAPDVEVGPYCVIGPGVRVGEGTRLLSHVVLTGRTAIGRNNVIHPFAAIGGEAQMRKAPTPRDPARETLAIGDDNVVREHVTIHVSTGEQVTTIGSHNLLMVSCHVAHDVVIGSHCIVANAVQLAGHVVVEDYAVFGGLAGVAQRRRIGQSAFVAAGAMCERDVPPFVIVQGDRARVRALNVVGLERRGVPSESIAKLRRAFAAAFVRRERQLDTTDAWVKILSDFLGRT